MYLVSNFAHVSRVIDADAPLSIRESHKDDAVLEVLPIAGGQRDPALGVEGVIEGAG